MGELETIDGYVESRTPDTEVLMKKSHGGRQKVYHELHNGWEPGDFPPCGAHAKNANPHEYEVVSLKKAVTRWAEPCQHAECTEIRTRGASRRAYKRESTLFDMFWRQKLNLSQIAEKFDIDTHTVSHHMQLNRIPRTKDGYREKYGAEPPQKHYRDAEGGELEQINEEYDHLLYYNNRQENKVHLPNKDYSDTLCTYPTLQSTKPVPATKTLTNDVCKQCIQRWRS